MSEQPKPRTEDMMLLPKQRQTANTTLIDPWKLLAKQLEENKQVIKYQAWHLHRRRMYEVTMLQWSAAEPDVLSKVELLSLDGMHEIHNVYGHTIKDNLILREYAGLKDKNGREGYRGDIVKMFNRSLFAIVWDEYYARFQLELVSGKEHKKVFDMGMLQQGEIVGNIYEHTELLRA